MDEEFYVDPRYLLELLDAMDCEYVTLLLPDGRLPLYIGGDQGLFALIMPMVKGR